MDYRAYSIGPSGNGAKIYLKKNLNMHKRMHIWRSNWSFPNICPKVSCQSTFRTPSELENHLRVHNNDPDRCRYCPFICVIGGGRRLAHELSTSSGGRYRRRASSACCTPLTLHSCSGRHSSPVDFNASNVPLPQCLFFSLRSS